MGKIITVNINNADKSWTFLDGSKRSVVILGSVVIGRGEYLPGWKWSEHVGKMTGKTSQSHIGFIESGKMIIQDSSGKKTLVKPGDAFEVEAGHDAWVVGNKPCIALDFESSLNKSNETS